MPLWHASESGQVNCTKCGMEVKVCEWMEFILKIVDLTLYYELYYYGC